MPILEERELRGLLEACGQHRLIAHMTSLDGERSARLAAQLSEMDLGAMPALIETYVRRRPEFRMPEALEPAPYYASSESTGGSGIAFDRAPVRAAGEALLREGKVAAFTVAGGQGSRLGFDAPKGCFPCGPVTGKSLFAFFAEGLLGVGDRYGKAPPWYIMTSPLNHADTVTFFSEHDHFGLDPHDVLFFPQGTVPSFDTATGDFLLAAPDRVAVNPDGHGGSLGALFRSGALDEMADRGVEQISYFQVDNPIVRTIDPVFLGLHASAADSSGEMSSKMVQKSYPEEKLGVFCRSAGKTCVIEYSDLPEELAQERRDDGSLRFDAGSLAVHVMSVDFVRRVNTDAAFSLPWHRAEKKVACWDPERGDVEPESPNAVKLERFVFDALPMCEASILLETSRQNEFAPIKNATGVDSVESSREIQTARAAAWLESRGVEIPRDAEGKPDCLLELSPRTAMFPEHLEGVDLPTRIERGQSVSL
jgi:UDP-N-acetylglucosamine/UDP-N-acetylgalactosamine diphosphorylase